MGFQTMYTLKNCKSWAMSTCFSHCSHSFSDFFDLVSLETQNLKKVCLSLSFIHFIVIKTLRIASCVQLSLIWKVCLILILFFYLWFSNNFIGTLVLNSPFSLSLTPLPPTLTSWWWQVPRGASGREVIYYFFFALTLLTTVIEFVLDETGAGSASN